MKIVKWKTDLEVLGHVTIKNARLMSQNYGRYKVMIEVAFRKFVLMSG